MKKMLLQTSDFGSGKTEVFLYPSLNKKSCRLFVILKGIYGFHNGKPQNATDLHGMHWDQAFVQFFRHYGSVVCMNTSRLSGADMSSFPGRRAAFEGKSFEQEVLDIERAYKHVLIKAFADGELLDHVHIIAKSFGGTALLGSPYMLHQASSVSFIGSGCGSKHKTTKPLLASLYPEERLLSAIRNYGGLFTHYRGEEDDVVPVESQKRIVEASGASVNSYVVFKGVDHAFNRKDGRESFIPHAELRDRILADVNRSEGLSY